MADPRISENPKIAILGASGRAAAASASMAGFQVGVADYFIDQDTQQYCYTTLCGLDPNRLLAWFKSEQFDTWLYVGGIENNPSLINSLNLICPLLGNSSEVLKQVRDPFYLQQLINQTDFQFPDTLEERPDENLDQYLMKPYASAGGIKVCRVLENIFHSKDTDVYFQKIIPGTVYSCAFLKSSNQLRLLGFSKQLLGKSWHAPSEFQYAGNITVKISDKYQRQATALAKLLVTETELSGIFGIDFILHNQMLYLLEVNPRYTASMELFEANLSQSLVELHYQAYQAIKTELAVESKSGNHFGKLIVFASQAFRYQSDLHEKLLKNIAMIRNTNRRLPLLADIPQFDNLIETDDPIFTIFAEDKRSEEVENHLRNQLEIIQHSIQEFTN